MKKLLIILSIIAISTACNNNQEKAVTKQMPKTAVVKKTNTYGQDIKSDKIGDIHRLPALLEANNSVEVNFVGPVKEVCQASGCWLDIDLGNDEVVHVTFKDEAFVVPKDLAGSMVIIEGVGTKEIISIEMQKKAAKSEGQSQKDIDAINTPLTEYYYEATGVRKTDR